MRIYIILFCSHCHGIAMVTVVKIPSAVRAFLGCECESCMMLRVQTRVSLQRFEWNAVHTVLHIQTLFLVQRKDAHTRINTQQHTPHIHAYRRWHVDCENAVVFQTIECNTRRVFDRKSTLTENTILDLVRPHPRAASASVEQKKLFRLNVCDVCVRCAFTSIVRYLLSTQYERDTTKVEERTVPMISIVLN